MAFTQRLKLPILCFTVQHSAITVAKILLSDILFSAPASLIFMGKSLSKLYSVSFTSTDKFETILFNIFSPENAKF